MQAASGSSSEGDDVSVLDVTGQQLGALQLQPHLIEVDLTNNRLREMPDFTVLDRVTTLCLRQNLLSTLQGLHFLTTLQELDVYDNRCRSMALFRI